MIGRSAAKHRTGEGSETIENTLCQVEVSRVGFLPEARGGILK